MLLAIKDLCRVHGKAGMQCTLVAISISSKHKTEKTAKEHLTIGIWCFSDCALTVTKMYCGGLSSSLFFSYLHPETNMH